MKSVFIRVAGKVQDVWFRKSTKDKADQLGLKGTVQNQSDGTVHIYAVGEHDSLTELEKWCWEGPPESDVTNVERFEVEMRSYDDFRII